MPKGAGQHPAAIYFGGRSEEVSWVAHDAATMFPDMALLVMNYRGYGDSHGNPGELRMIEDGKMLIDWLAAHRRVDPARIAVVGRSLGSGIALQVAAHRPVAALALITPYDSVLALAKRRFRGMPVAYFLKHRFESVKYAEQVSAPTLVLRAETDDVVPHLHTDSLVSRLGGIVVDQTIPGSDHRNIPRLPETQQRIALFLRERFFAPEPATVIARSPAETPAPTLVAAAV
jgi:dipeptidyl aminopeptidase/acylaminoacyl peptidase